MTIRTAAVPALALSATLALAGCSGAGDASSQAPPSNDGSTSQAPATPHAQEHDSASGQKDAGGAKVEAPDLPDGVNEADVKFARAMIPHHQQAVEMSEMLLAKDGVDSRVRRLAEKIKAAQGPEIDKLQGWLQEWGVPDPSDSGMGHGMDGMMSEQDMAELGEASGPEAAVLFLEQMVRHHEGAVEMARTERESGSDPQAVDLAQSIIDAQEAEIARMQDLLEVL